jgi:succinyl-diaminopimelate desuccinylase
MTDTLQRLLSLVDRQRLRDTLYDLVCVPSPTGQARPVANRLAEIWRELGLSDVELIETPGWSNSPSVVGWLRGQGNGPVLHFNGHMDHIHQAHVAPYLDGERVVGRGAADMKSGLACMIELARVLQAAGVELPGDLLFSSHDLHEDPIGHGEGVRTLIEHGFTGDAVVVAEGPPHEFFVAGKSNSLVEIDLQWAGDPIHELNVTPEMPNLIEVGADVVLALRELKGRIAARVDDLFGPESFFLGILRAGDFYNRLPTRCHITATRRFPPETRRFDVEAEIRDAVRAAVGDRPVQALVDASTGNDGFRISADEPIAAALRGAYAQVTGRELPLGIQLFGADNAKFIAWGGTPAVAHGVGLAQAHAELEWCDARDLERVTHVFLATVMKFYEQAT